MTEQDNTTSKNYWAVVPAAGVGKRMGGHTPKQYLNIAGKMVIEHTCQRLLDHPQISGLIVALGDHDEYWSDVSLVSDKPVVRVDGGEERADSVLNALLGLLETDIGASKDDWVLVHDAARPCIRHEDMTKLIHKVADSGSGGLLALPVRDTMKRQLAGQSIVAETVDRTGLWHALTPQMFHLQTLIEALQKAAKENVVITDEASAMEHIGLMPLLVEGHEDNIKITRKPDLKLAEMYLLNQNNE